MRRISRTIVSALIFSSDDKLLMGMKDVNGGGVYADCWHIPGGGVDGGESLEQALEREILEEVGADVSKAHIVLVDDKGRGQTEKTLKDTGEKVLCEMRFNVFRVDLSDAAADILLKPGDDLVKLKWVELANLNNYKLRHPRPRFLNVYELLRKRYDETMQNEEYPQAIQELIAAWKPFVDGIDDWQKLVEGVTPKETYCGPIYELKSPLTRPNESFAVADMRKVKVAEPHYHTNGETEVYFVVSGSGVTVDGGEEIQLVPGVVVVTPPNTAHFTIPKENLVLVVINTPPFNPANNIHVAHSDPNVGFDEAQFERLKGE